MKTILVTGGAGFIGSQLCQKLLDLQYSVICIDNLQTGSLNNIKQETIEFLSFKIIVKNKEWIYK